MKKEKKRGKTDEKHGTLKTRLYTDDKGYNNDHNTRISGILMIVTISKIREPETGVAIGQRTHVGQQQQQHLSHVLRALAGFWWGLFYGPPLCIWYITGTYGFHKYSRTVTAMPVHQCGRYLLRGSSWGRRWTCAWNLWT